MRNEFDLFNSFDREIRQLQLPSFAISIYYGCEGPGEKYSDEISNYGW
jgi:hypothetical protein